MEKLKKMKMWLERCVEGNYLTGLILVGAVLGTAFLVLMPTAINRFLVNDAGPTIVEYMAKTITFILEDVIWVFGRNLLGWNDPAVGQGIHGWQWQWMPYAAVGAFVVFWIVVLIVVLIVGLLAIAGVRWLYAHRPVIMWRSTYQDVLDGCNKSLKTCKTMFDHSYDQDVKHRLEVGRLQDKLVELEQRLYDTRTERGRQAVQRVREDLTDWLLGEWWVGEYAKIHLEARRRKPVEPTASVGVN